MPKQDDVVRKAHWRVVFWREAALLDLHILRVAAIIPRELSVWIRQVHLHSVELAFDNRLANPGVAMDAFSLQWADGYIQVLDNIRDQHRAVKSFSRLDPDREVIDQILAKVGCEANDHDFWVIEVLFNASRVAVGRTTRAAADVLNVMAVPFDIAAAALDQID